MAATGCLNSTVTARAPTGVANAVSGNAAPVALNGANAPVPARTCSTCGITAVPLTRWPVAVALGSRTVNAAAVAVEVTTPAIDAT